MPIEDIDFLYQNSIKENIIILVDSSKRNKLLYPNVSEFQIDFIEPFNFVYGIEVIDTTIPRTTFMIDNYNDELIYKEGFNILDQDSYNIIKFVNQDFSTAEIFYQRFNEQLVEYTEDFEIDNYENKFDNSIVEQRTKSDYPIVRFINRKPFLFDMNNSSIFNILGFDQFPKSEDSYKYTTVDSILNNYIPINMIPYDNITPYEYASVKRYTSIDTVVNDAEQTLNTVKFNYVHRPKYRIGSFLQYLKISSNKTNVYTGDTVISISMRNITTNKQVFSNLTNIIFNKIIGFIEFPYQTSYLLGDTQPNTHLILKVNHTYEITINNVFVNQQDLNSFKMEITMGIAYFINLQKMDISNPKLFISKPIFSESDNTKLTISSVTSDTTLVINCDVNESLVFDVTIPVNMTGKLSLFPSFTIRYFEIDVVKNNLISKDDLFVLTIKKKYINTESTEHICEFILQYKFDTETNKAVLYCENTYLDSIFNYTDFKINIDPLDNNNVNNVLINCQLYAKTHGVQVIGNTSDHNIKINLEFFKEFGLISPGMVNLASENYLILRCEEIENHLRGSYDVKDFSPGLGVLNIDVQGYASGRTEFFSVKYKEFHPIGKLSKMKFRFERKTDGKLYDFKNIDLHFILSIKFLRPIQKEFFNKSTLNPNYNPNYLGYFNKTLQDHYDEESSDDDSDIDEKYFESEFNDRENELIHRINKQNRSFESD
tara:strand:- start:77 stop:2218 length:2142 start_codon:yes stop_codon:yes gene_type:complete